MKYSVSTVCLPDLDMAGQCALLRKLGYDGIELRCRRVSAEVRASGVPGNWGYHVNDVTPENLGDLSGRLGAILSDHGLRLVGLATHVSCLDLEQFKAVLEGAVKVGAPFVRVGASAGYAGSDSEESYRVIYGETLAGLARCLDLARGTGVKLALEIHGGTIHCSASLGYRIASNFSPDEMGVIYDPNNLVRYGNEPVELALPMLGPYLLHCHVGGHRPVARGLDSHGTRIWEWESCSLSEGLFDHGAMMAELGRLGYDGFITVEDFRPGMSHEDRLGEGLRYLRGLECS